MKSVVLLLLLFVLGVASNQLLTLKLLNGTVVPLWSYADDVGVKFECKYTRYSVAECIRDYLDLDADSAITEHEIDAAKLRYMWWIERTLEVIMSSGTSRDIRERCDLNENGKIDLNDLVDWNQKCLELFATAEEANNAEGCLCNCRAINAISKYVCDRARKT